MTRKLKALGLAFVAVLAFGALSATAASAASFHSEQAHTILDGKQPVAEDDIFTYNAGTYRCKELNYGGTQSSATTETVTVTPAYSECTAFGFVNAPIDVNGCSYTFNSSESTTLTCPSSGAMIITAFNCHVKVGTQSVASGVAYDNAGSGKTRDVTATFNLSGIKYTQESKTFPGCTNGTFSNGTYKGSATITGTNTAGEQVGVWHTA